MSIEKNKDCLELSAIKSCFVRLDNMSCVKTNVTVVRVVTLGRYLTYPARVIQVLI